MISNNGIFHINYPNLGYNIKQWIQLYSNLFPIQVLILFFSQYSAMITVFVTLLIMGTIYDVSNTFVSTETDPTNNSAQKMTTLRILRCFSLFKNWKNFVSTRKVDGSIDCIHGIRFLSLCWIVLSHTWWAVLRVQIKDNILQFQEVKVIVFSTNS